MKSRFEETDSMGYIGVCYEEHCNEDATCLLIHHHHEGIPDCNIQRNDDNHCAMMFCEKHADDVAQGEKVAIKPEIVNRHE